MLFTCATKATCTWAMAKIQSSFQLLEVLLVHWKGESQRPPLPGSNGISQWSYRKDPEENDTASIWGLRVQLAQTAALGKAATHLSISCCLIFWSFRVLFYCFQFKSTIKQTWERKQTKENGGRGGWKHDINSRHPNPLKICLTVFVAEWLSYSDG